jgi:hypothetical protein
MIIMEIPEELRSGIFGNKDLLSMPDFDLSGDFITRIPI